MSRKTRITHIITGLATGGAETMLLKLLQKIDKNRFQSTVIALTDAGPIADRIRELDIPVTVLGISRSLPTPLDFFRLYRRIKYERPDVVQTWLYHADLLGSLAAKLARVKKLAWNIRCSYMGDDYYRGMSGLVIKALAALSGNPDTIVVNSGSGKELHESLGYRSTNWQVIPNGFDVGIFRPSGESRQKIRQELNIGPDVPVIGMIGRWDPVKGHDLFLAAALKLSGKIPDCHFVIVGKDCDEENVDLINLVDDKMRPNLHLMGERHDIPEVTNAFDLAVCASIGEGFPNILGEAMACEVPCVATNVGDCAEIILDTGRVVPSGDVTEMAGAWMDLLSLPPDELTELGMKARERVRDTYNIEKVIQTYQDLYLGLVHQD
jgi:glycosyltransferase involved in cell wall biosynthesis